MQTEFKGAYFHTLDGELRAITMAKTGEQFAVVEMKDSHRDELYGVTKVQPAKNV